MATGKQIFKQVDILIEEHGLVKAKGLIEDRIKYGKNSVTNALLEVALSSVKSKLEK